MPDSQVLALPTYATSFVGRTEEIRAVAALLCASDQRVVTLLGSSGAGKSRLSREVALQVASTFPDGVVFVALAAIDDPALVLPTIAQTLDIVEQPDIALDITLAAALRDKTTLLILDNFEQVHTAAAALATLSASTHHLTLLITSQVPLAIGDAALYLLPPLTMPALSAPHTSDELLRYPAIALFVERLRETQPQFELTEDNAGAVREMCARVAGLPLAIELVAAHSWGLQPAQVRDLLSSHLALVPLRDVMHLDNDQVLAPLLDWCFAMLEPDTQTLFMRLGVFVGGCTLAALAPVCNAHNDLSLHLPAAMQVLASKHLVLQETQDGQDTRYIMLDAVHSYVERRLALSRTDMLIADAHAGYFQQLADDANLGLTGVEQRRWLTLLTAEQPNMRAALHWLIAQQHYDRAALFVGSLARFWYMRSHLREGRQWVEQVLAHAHTLSDSSHAAALHGAGMIGAAQSDYVMAEQWLRAALALRTTLGDQHGVGLLLNNLGLIAWRHDQLDEAQRLFEESIACLRPFDDRNAIANALTNLGIIAYEHGDWNRSAAYYEECLDLRRTLGNAHATAICLNNFGVTALAQNDLAHAQTLLHESLAISRSLGAVSLIALAYSVLGKVQLDLGEHAAARESLLESLRLRHDIDDRAGVAEALGKLSMWALHAGDPTWAARTLSLVRRVRDEDDFGLDYLEQRWYIQTQAALQQTLGADAYQHAWAAGRADNLDTVVMAQIS